MQRSRLLLLVVLLATGCRPPIGASSNGGSGGTLSAPPEGMLQVAFLDVGQGDSSLVQVPGGVSVLVDGGPPDAGPRVIQAMRQAGVRKVDWMIGSHPHADHIGGFIDVLREVPVARALDPGYNHGTSTQKTYLTLLRERGVKTTLARAGQTYDLGSGARLEILAPQAPLLKGTDSDPNNNSIVARLVFGNSRFLFTGDMEEDERARLLKSVSPPALRAEVLKVAHHGSHNGTDPVFLEAVEPRYAVISLAKGNDYGHPHKEALEALKAQEAEILRTDERGTLVFTTDGKSLKLRTGVSSTGGGPGQTPTGVGKVIGNRSSKVYHSPTCGGLPEPEKRVPFGNAREAQQAGYRPHRACIR
jgi:competence protein ComEC